MAQNQEKQRRRARIQRVQLRGLVILRALRRLRQVKGGSRQQRRKLHLHLRGTPQHLRAGTLLALRQVFPLQQMLVQRQSRTRMPIRAREPLLRNEQLRVPARQSSLLHRSAAQMRARKERLRFPLLRF